MGTILHRAVKNNNLALVSWLLQQMNIESDVERKKKAIDKKDGDGRSSVSYAAENKTKIIMRLLLENHGDPNTRDTPNGITPLMYACENQNKEMIQLLLKHGANARD